MFQLLHCAKSQMAAIHQLASMNMQACFSPAALYHKMEWLIIILHAITTQHAVLELPPFFDVVSCVSFIGPRLPLGYGLVMHQVAERTLGNTKLRPHLGAHMGKFKVMLPFEYINSIRGSQVLKWSEIWRSKCFSRLQGLSFLWRNLQSYDLDFYNIKWWL